MRMNIKTFLFPLVKLGSVLVNSVVMTILLNQMMSFLWTAWMSGKGG